MLPVESPLLGLALTSLLLAGLAGAWLARQSEGTPREGFFQRLFYALLSTVGATTIVAVSLGPNCWLVSGGTLAAMVLTVTYDFRPSRRATAW